MLWNWHLKLEGWKYSKNTVSDFRIVINKHDSLYQNKSWGLNIKILNWRYKCPTGKRGWQFYSAQMEKLFLGAIGDKWWGVDSQGCGVSTEPARRQSRVHPMSELQTVEFSSWGCGSIVGPRSWGASGPNLHEHRCGLSFKACVEIICPGWLEVGANPSVELCVLETLGP